MPRHGLEALVSVRSLQQPQLCHSASFSARTCTPIALIPRSPADTVPRACHPHNGFESDDGRLTSAYAPGTLVPGIDPDAAALLGGLRLRDPAALRHGSRRRHLSSRHDVARARPEAVGCGLCAAVAAAQGWPLRREPEPVAALLPVPGHPETVAARFAGAV